MIPLTLNTFIHFNLVSKIFLKNIIFKKIDYMKNLQTKIL
jgi:hypothetical protein